MVKVKYYIMNKLFFIFLLLALSLFLPNRSVAASNLSLNNLSFKEVLTAVGDYKAFKATNGLADVVIHYKVGSTGQTKISGMPGGMVAVSDWQVGDKLAVVGELNGYSNGMAVIVATELKFLSKDVSIIKQDYTVESLDKTDPSNVKLLLSGKEGNNFKLTLVERFGQASAPRISGNTNWELFMPGTTVTASLVKRKTNSNYVYKLVELKKTDKPLSSAKRLMDIVVATTNGTYKLNPLLKSPMVLLKKNQLVIQDSAGGLVYLKNTDSLKRIFSLPSGDAYFLLKTGKNQTLTVKNNAPLNEEIELEFYTGTEVNGHLNSPTLVLRVNVKVEN